MKLNIVIFSNQLFDQPLKTNKWHIATRLAKLGHNVIFIDPATRFNTLKSLLKGEFSLKRFLTGTKREASNFFIYTPVHIFNFKPFSFVNTWFHSMRINNLFKNFGDHPTVFWIYHFDYPDLENFLTKFKYDLLIYDVVDEYTAFPEYANKKTTNKGLIALIQKFDHALQIKLNQGGLSGKEWVIKREKWLSEVCDFIFASAPGLVLKFQKILKNLNKNESNVHFFPNSGDYLRFKDSKSLVDEMPEDMKEIKRPRITFTGAIDSYKVNVELIEMCASSYPEYSFVIIGPEKVSDPDLDLTKLKSFKNVYFLGMKPYETLPSYFSGSDAFIIPYNLNEYTIGGCFPVKFHDALAAGLPVLVTNMPVYKDFADVCYIAKNEAEFIDNLQKSLEEDSQKKIKARQDVAKNNSWDGKVQNQLKLIEGTLDKSK